MTVWIRKILYEDREVWSNNHPVVVITNDDAFSNKKNSFQKSKSVSNPNLGWLTIEKRNSNSNNNFNRDLNGQVSPRGNNVDKTLSPRSNTSPRNHEGSSDDESVGGKQEVEMSYKDFKAGREGNNHR